VTANWDIFADEQKARDGSAAAIGLLCIERGVVCQLAQELIQRKTDIENRLSIRKLASPHWVEMKRHMDDVAIEWFDEFFTGPLSFFVYVPAPATVSRLDLVKAAIERLEADPRVPHGLHRSATTIHLDYDHQDARELDIELVRGFGVLRAFHWDDRGSPLLQLTDLLLGMSERLHTGRTLPPSDAEARRQRAISSARASFDKHGKKNLGVAYEPDGSLKHLLT